MARMLMIVPTRGRPQSIAPIVDCWRDTGASADLLFAMDDDDPALPDYQSAAIATGAPDFGLSGESGPRLRLTGTLNSIATREAPRYKAIGFMGDDHRPRTPGWDRRFTECLSGGGPGIVYGNDLLVGEWMPTAVAMTTDIITTLGYMAPPTLVHLCIDLVWKDWGQALGRITYLPDVIIEHLHPAAGKAQMDEGYQDANSPERTETDHAAYRDYRDGRFHDDVQKLRALL